MNTVEQTEIDDCWYAKEVRKLFQQYKIIGKCTQETYVKKTLRRRYHTSNGKFRHVEIFEKFLKLF